MRSNQLNPKINKQINQSIVLVYPNFFCSFQKETLLLLVVISSVKYKYKTNENKTLKIHFYLFIFYQKQQTIVKSWLIMGKKKTVLLTLPQLYAGKLNLVCTSQTETEA